jgi:peptide/nickel transport system substrate-binding protein
MRNDRVLGGLGLGALALVLVLLVIVLVQQHRLEQRFITQSQQLRALGEATDRLAAGGVIRAAGAPSGAVPSNIAPPGVKFLHPEVPNFLTERDVHVPPPGANLDGVLSRGWYMGDPKGFNPLLNNGAENTEYLATYGATSLGTPNRFTDPNSWYGELAYRIEITDDFKEFTAYLRSDYEWQQPAGVDLSNPRFAWLKGKHPITARDYVFMLDSILNPQVQSGPYKNYYAEVESYRAIDDTTLVIRWKKKQFTNIDFTVGLSPLPEFIYAFDEDGKRFPKETFGLRFNQHWYNNKGLVMSGAYRMVSYEPGSRIVLERNQNYPGEKPAIKSMVYPIYTDPTQTLLKLKAHELNVGELQPGQYREEVLKYEQAGQKPKSPFFDGSIQCQTVAEAAYRYIGWNANLPMFSDKRVRRALTHAFDRKRLIQSVYVGLGEIATSPYPAGSPYNDPSIEPIPFDLDAARKLLKEAGWEDSNADGLVDKQLAPGDKQRTPFEFSFMVHSARKENAIAASILREDLLKIGVKMNLDVVEWSLFLKRTDERRFEGVLSAWTVTWNPDLFQIWHSSQADIPRGSNRIGFRHKQADAIIEKLRETFDMAERTKLLREFHRIVDDEQPVSFFMTPKSVVCAWKEVKDIRFSKVYPVVNALPWQVARQAP